MNRIDRILAMYAGTLTAEEAVAIGVTLDDADAALSLRRLDVELEERVRRQRVIQEMRDFLRDTQD